ncbi:universal stress protein [Salidesulfovibrio brasiliensis]|uniref:universal stress protein n=1 Tax=Salidesulfovibrio brasiliensis TaxID=221711 RepID=UPI0006D24914|nr:universal stress protein [Salidesulfovibrio brasiliensis]
MLQRAAVKTSLGEPRKKFLEMIEFLGNYGTKEIRLIHVRTKTNYRQREEAEEKLALLCAEIEQLGFSAESVIRNGSAPSVTIDVAEEVGADYLTIYWQPKALLRNALLGSIDSDILRMSNLPVFIYNPRLFRPVTELESVLYATDFKYTDAVIMPYLINSRFKAKHLYLLHVGERAPDPMTEEERKQRVVDNLQRLADECAHAYEEVEVIETIGRVYKQIVRQAKAKAVELIVVGKSENPDTMSRLIGSTAEILPHKAHCSVFVIPGVCALPAPDETA